MTETELADAKQDLADFAAAEGYTLGTVYVERIDHVPAAFACLLDELEREDARAVVVPGLHHLAVVGVTPSLRDHLERRTGARC